jgi:hypothetical protein
VLARDAGLRRISAVTRWTAAGAVALSGVLALIAANAFHGRTVATTPARTPTTASSHGSTPARTTTTPRALTQTTTSTSSSSALQPPTQVPTPTPATPAVVSGGS